MKLRSGQDRRILPRGGPDRRGDGPGLIFGLVMLVWTLALAFATYVAVSP